MREILKMGILTQHIQVKSENVDETTAGTYAVVYTVTDSHQNTTEITVLSLSRMIQT